MFVIIEISTVLRVFQRIVEYRKLERISDLEIIKTGKIINS